MPKRNEKNLKASVIAFPLLPEKRAKHIASHLESA